MSVKLRLPPCGNPDCGCSTGIHEGLTFGSGEIDRWGYFEKPCRICAADWDSRRRQTKETMRAKMLADGLKPGSVDEYLSEAGWLNLPAWPYTAVPPSIPAATADTEGRQG